MGSLRAVEFERRDKKRMTPTPTLDPCRVWVDTMAAWQSV
ncbi:hypothetical protein SAMN04488238_11012 [Roseicitreum antarcticum]|uniref:Transposase n=1 Tax=Roseicitreum antarcticum TaxID=564137 RepID=A0A1H3CPQ0_9RHOB|nr:hypothetical protein SAMN04488238_11012 [Roseicitreum antarcticum]